MVIGYIRTSTDKQDLNNQKYAILEYSQQKKIIIDEFIEVEVSATKNQKARKLDIVFSKLQKGDTLIVTELSRIGRNMLETINIIQDLIIKQIEVIFIRQPELSVNTAHGKFMITVYSYFAEAERDFISMRTKQGLAAAKAKGIKLGRKFGSKQKNHVLDKVKDDIKQLLTLNMPVSSIAKFINPRLESPKTYVVYRHYIMNNKELSDIISKKKDNKNEVGTKL